VSPEWNKLRQKTLQLLQEEAELEEIVRLVGFDALSLKDKLKLETARSIREDYLHQNAFHDIDTYTSLEKQFGMLKLILMWGELGEKALDAGAEFSKISSLSVREDIGRAKYVEESDVKQRFAEIEKKLKQEMSVIYEEGGIDVA
jgi:V/A-type H+-transporting ATPase subunit A